MFKTYTNIAFRELRSSLVSRTQTPYGGDTPAEVLDWVYGIVCDPTALQHVFDATRFLRRLDASGYVRFRHWRMDREPGLARRAAVVWLYEEQLTISYRDDGACTVMLHA
jgi:hypothetical protein